MTGPLSQLPARFDVLGTPISCVGLDEVFQLTQQWSQDQTGRFICARDVASLMAIRSIPHLAELHSRAAIVLPDGAPIAAVGRLKGMQARRACGPDFFEMHCERSAHSGLRHYLFGGNVGIAQSLKSALEQKYPEILIVGIETPPFRKQTEKEARATIHRIRASNADIVWVGISSPKQDEWMLNMYEHLPQTLIGVGAAFDFLSGAVPRAPKAMQQFGLEWMYRLYQEPRRLWKRYLLTAPRFVLALMLYEINKALLRN